MALVTLEMVRTEANVSRQLLTQAQDNALLDSAIALGIAHLVDDHSGQAWPLDGTSHSVEVGGIPVLVSIADESGKIDLNTAPDELMAALFRANGMQSPNAQALSERIGDWRDADNERKPHGAERADYAGAHLSYGVRNGPMESASELRQVLGVSQSVFRCLEPDVTVYSNVAGVDITHASVQVRRALDQSTSGSRQESPPAADLSSSPAGRVFSIRASKEQTEPGAQAREAVVRISGASQRPFWTMSWSEKNQLESAEPTNCGTP